MNIIIDSNVLFSALIKNSVTRKVLLEYEDFFLFPSYILIELRKHKKEVLNKSRMTEKDFDKLLQLILSRVLMVQTGDLLTYRKKALEIVKDIDINDVLFVACALAHKNSVIWSDDKALKTQKKVKVINTKEILKMLKKPQTI